MTPGCRGDDLRQRAVQPMVGRERTDRLAVSGLGVVFAQLASRIDAAMRSEHQTLGTVRPWVDFVMVTPPDMAVIRDGNEV